MTTPDRDEVCPTCRVSDRQLLEMAIRTSCPDQWHAHEREHVQVLPDRDEAVVVQVELSDCGVCGAERPGHSDSCSVRYDELETQLEEAEADKKAAIELLARVTYDHCSDGCHSSLALGKTEDDPTP